MSSMRPALAALGWLRRQTAGEQLHALIRRASAVLLLQVAGAGVMFLTGIVLGHTLGAEAYGQLSFAITLVIILRLGASAGLPMLMMKSVAVFHGAKDWPRLKGLLRYAGLTTLGSGAVTALIATAAVLFIAPRPLPSTAILILMALPLLLVLPITETAAGTLRGFHRVAAGQASEFSRSGLYLALLAGALWFTSHGLSAEIALALRFGAEALGMVLTLLVLAWLWPKELRGAKPIGQARDWRAGQISFLAIEGAYLIYQQTDILLLGLMRPMAEVGVYRMASNLGFVLVFASLMAGAVLGPVAASAWAAGRTADLKHAAARLSRLSFALTLALYLALIAAVPAFVRLLGPEFAGMTWPLVILGASHVIRALMSASPTLVLMTGSERTAAYGIAATAGVNLLLNAALIPFFGMIGAAIATALSSTALSVFYAVLAYRRTGISGTIFNFGTSLVPRAA